MHKTLKFGLKIGKFHPKMQMLQVGMQLLEQVKF